jgi:2-polyprenyl-3-methyl-5-hydroxy-6-metoxy-1,4-benzoquinol methylase
LKSSVRRILSLIRGFLRTCIAQLRNRIFGDPAEVVKTNTRDGFEHFWRHEKFIAATYLDRDRRRLYQILAEYVADTVDTIESPRVRIADIGCGPGFLLEVLNKTLRKTDVELVGVDFAMAATVQASRRNPNAHFCTSDVRALSLRPSTFDLVLCVETLEHLRDPDPALAGLANICRNSGHIIVTVPDGTLDKWDGHENYWSQADLHKLLSASIGVPNITRLHLWDGQDILLAHVRRGSQTR